MSSKETINLMSAESIQHIVMAVVNGISSAAGILGNTFVLVILFKNRGYLHGINLFIAALALTDLSVCLIVQPVFIYLLFGTLNKNTLKAFDNNVFAVLIQVSLNLLLCIAISRFLEITYPYFYRSFATKSRIVVIILIVSVISTTQGMLFNSVSSMESAEPFFQYATIAAFLIIYGKIYLIARKHRNEIICQTRSLAYNYGPTGLRFTRLKNSTITTGLITGTFVLCFLPFSIVNMMDNEDSDTDEHEVVRLWVSTIVSSSSSLNAYIYALRSENFKNAVTKEFQAKYCCKKTDATNGSNCKEHVQNVA
jgi:hypothetical protein